MRTMPEVVSALVSTDWCRGCERCAKWCPWLSDGAQGWTVPRVGRCPGMDGAVVVAGTRTPSPLNEATKSEHNAALVSLEKAMPKVYTELDAIQKKLEKHYKDMQDIEFTIQEGKLYMLQCRVGKRTGTAALGGVASPAAIRTGRRCATGVASAR